MKEKLTLDRIDCTLLRLLRKNARISNKDLAERAGIAQSTCLERVRRMRVGGVITGYHADMNPLALGIGIQAMVAVKLTRHRRRTVEDFRARMLGREEVIGLYHVAGANDFLVHVAARDSEHLRHLAMEAFTESPDVAHIETGLIFDFARSGNLPIYDSPEEA